MRRSRDIRKADFRADKLALYDALIATVSGVERKGASMAYTSQGGHMFSYMNAQGILALRLPPSEREAFMARHDAKLHEAHGHVQKEYVTVPPQVLADTDALKPYFEASHRYVLAMRPKPGKPGRVP